MSTEEKIELLEDIRTFIKKERTLEELCSKYEMTEFQIMGLIGELKQEGMPILTTKDKKEIMIVTNPNLKLSSDETQKIECAGNSSRFGVVSDTILGSKYQQLTILNDIYKRFHHEDVEFVLHCGDMVGGVYSNKSPYADSLFKHGINEQCNYIEDMYPSIGVPTHFITGEKETSLKKSDKNFRDPGKIINDSREDMNYLGQHRSMLQIKNTKILAKHPTGRVAYTLSYKAQQDASAMRSEDKADMVFYGHWFHALQMNYRTEIFTVPGVSATTPWMMDASIQNSVGAWIIDLEFDQKGKLAQIYPMSLPYYETDANDYKLAKKLVIKEDK